MEMEKVRTDLESAKLERDEIRRFMRRVHSEASAIASLASKMGDLEEYFEGIQRALEGFCDRNAEVERRVEERSRRVEEEERRLRRLQEEVDEKERELRSVDGLLIDRMAQLDVKMEEQSSVEGLLDRRTREFNGKTEELDSICKSIEERRRQQLDLVERVRECETYEKHLECLKMQVEEKELELYEKQHCETKRSIDEDALVLASKKKALVSFENAVKNASRETVAKEGGLETATKSLEQLERDISAKRQESGLVLESTQQVVEDLGSKRGKLREKTKELDDIRQSVNDRAKELKTTGRNIESIKVQVEEKSRERELKTKQNSELQKSIEEHLAALASKKEALVSFKKSVKKASRELVAKDNRLESATKTPEQLQKDISAKGQESTSILESTKRLDEDLESKREELKVSCSKIDQCNAELEAEERPRDGMQKRKKRRLTIVRDSVVNIGKELEMKKSELKNAKQQLRLLQTEAEAKEEKLSCLEKSRDEISEDLVLKREELSLLRISCSQVDSRFLELKSQEKEMECMLESKKKEIDSLETCRFYILHQQEQLKMVRRRLLDCVKALETKRMELEKMIATSNERQTMLDAKEQQLHFLQLSLDQHDQDLKLRETSLSQKFIDFELQQQRFWVVKNSPEDHRRKEVLLPGYDEVDPPKKKRRQPSDARADYIRPCDVNIFEEELWEAKVGKLDPAKVVLDLIEGSYGQHVNGEDDNGSGEEVFAANSILLEQLSEAAPSVFPEIRARALKLAREWKLKLRARGGPAAVSAFLHLLAAYKLTGSFDQREIKELAESSSLTDTHPGLCQLLGLSGTAASSAKSQTAEIVESSRL